MLSKINASSMSTANIQDQDGLSQAASSISMHGNIFYLLVRSVYINLRRVIYLKPVDFLVSQRTMVGIIKEYDCD